MRIDHRYIIVGVAAAALAAVVTAARTARSSSLFIWTDPEITSLSPSTVAAGGPDFILTVTGASFQGEAVVRWNGEPRPTTVQTSVSARALIRAVDVASPGTVKVTVANPVAAGETPRVSNALVFTITAAQPYRKTVESKPQARTGSSPR